MIAAVFILSALVVGEAWVIYELLNRLLTQAKIPAMTQIPKFHGEHAEESEAEQRRALFSVDIPS